MTKCKFYQEEIDKCVFDGPSDDCPYKDDLSKCNCFEQYKEEETRASDTVTEIVMNRPPIKLELVQYPYSKAGRPTVYLDDYQIAGPRAFGVGHTVASYELTKENLKDIQRIVTRELNRMKGILSNKENTI